MYILSTDTTAKTASVCVSSYSDGILKPLSRSTVNGTLTHSESLLPMIDFCLKNAGLAFSDIDMTATSVGPGSFTGVRIGSATIKGLVFTRPEVACVGVSTLASLAYNLSDNRSTIILAVMDARRNQFYNAGFTFSRVGKQKRLYDDDLADFESIMTRLEENYAGKKVVLVGDGAELFYRLYQKRDDNKVSVTPCGYENMYEDAFSVARCAVCEYENAPDKGVFTTERLNPIYLRASQAERERNERLSEGGNK